MFRTLIYPSSGAIHRKFTLTLNHPSVQNKTTDVVIQKHSRKLLMMGILMSETCWAHKKWNKIASDIKLVFHSSTTSECFYRLYFSYNIIVMFWLAFYLFIFTKTFHSAEVPAVFNPLTPNDLYISRTAPLTCTRCILYIYSTKVGTEYFKYALYSPFFFLLKMQFVS